MQTKPLYALIHIRCEVGTVKLVKFFFLTDGSTVMFLLWIFFVICVCFCLTGMSVFAAVCHLLGKC